MHGREKRSKVEQEIFFWPRKHPRRGAKWKAVALGRNVKENGGAFSPKPHGNL